MHNYTRLKIEESKTNYYKEVKIKWLQTAESMNARGMFDSTAHISLFLDIGFEYVNRIVDILFDAEKSALSSEPSLPEDKYFIELQDEIINMVVYEYGIIRSKALERFKTLGDRGKADILTLVGKEEGTKRASISRRVQMLREELKIQAAKYSSQATVDTVDNKSINRLKSVPKYDVVLSFAGEDREHAEKLASLIRSDGFSVFYDKYEEHNLWGKNLYDHLTEVYSKRGRYCVMFLSKQYAAKQWPTLERRAAQERAFKENREYILPIRIDDTEIPGILDTVAYQDLREKSIEEIHGVLKRKLLPPEKHEDAQSQPGSIKKLGLSDEAIKLLTLLSSKSEHALDNEPLLTAEEVLSALDMPEEAVSIAADELEEKGLVKLHKAIGMGKVGFRYLGSTVRLFALTDSYLKNWNPARDSIDLAKVLLKIAQEGHAVSIQQADEVLKWGPRRLNPALYLLIANDVVDPSKAISPTYLAVHVILRPKIHRYIKNSQS